MPVFSVYVPLPCSGAELAIASRAAVVGSARWGQVALSWAEARDGEPFSERAARAGLAHASRSRVHLVGPGEVVAIGWWSATPATLDIYDLSRFRAWVGEAEAAQFLGDRVLGGRRVVEGPALG